MTIDETAVVRLGEIFAGTLLCPGDAGYDDTRRVHNGMIDKQPALIARCQGVADVVAAVNFARENTLEISVRGGGHNVAGRAVCEGGVMIDLAGQKGIHVDGHNLTARAQAGLNWGEFNRETQLHGLATTGGVIGTTGIAGLTLGGGIGYLMGRYGLTVDNLLSAEVVTADGRVLRAAKDENDDLFWGLRGGGGNFGIVTSFEYQLYPVGPEVTGGLIAFPFDDSFEVLRFYRDFAETLPDELVVFCGLVHAPDGSGTRLAAMIPCHCGRGINGMLDAGHPKGALNYWKSGFLKELKQDVIEVLIEQFSVCPSSMSSLLIERYHGAATRVGLEETAFAHRSPGYNLAIVSQWADPKDSEANIAWARDTYTAVNPHMSSGVYVNYLGDDDPAAQVQAAYGPNFERLQSIKDRYDPKNLFHLNQNIPPTSSV
jgi:FAD/FMN-containing dehydrogenase